MRTARSIALSLAFATVASTTSAETEGAAAAIESSLDRAREVVVGSGTRSEKLAALHEITRELLDTADMGQRALGAAFGAQTEAARSEFLVLFDEFAIRAYLRRLLLFKKPRFATDGVKPAGDHVVVKSRILTQRDEFYVNYEMHQRDGRWRAADVVIEGISLRGNYTEQFASLLRDRSFEEVLELMRRKLGLMRARDES